MTDPIGLTHRLVDVEGGRIHLVETGTGPLVLMVHGFPESWYSWRHQLRALAAAGYRAAAIDVRGYGRSSRPVEIDEYRMLALVADNVAVVRSLGAPNATIIGHDWGSPIAATSALLRPDLFTAVGLLSVPYRPPGGPRPTTVYGRIGGADEFYMSYFQTPGRAEAEIETDIRGWLAGVYSGLSGDAVERPAAGSLLFISPGAKMSDRFPPAGVLPSWLGEADLDFYAGEFERTGFTGALNRYRNVDRDWRDLAAWNGLPLGQPSIFIAGDRNESSLAGAMDKFATTLPGLSGSHLLAGAGHWVQEERPDEVNRLLIDWLASL